MDISQKQWWEGTQEDNNSAILDVRTPEEWEEGIIPGALLINIYSGQGFVDALEDLDKEKSYYVYCRSGARSAQACNVMQQLGFNTVYNLTGGILQWDGPVVQPKDE
ncbi:rhodanese-like domain-containing protein [Flavobacterium rhizosphaerae]|uniref:Rhodanese-like domain-containing protein n=1 Tax=Flavobacterium rhizosphaerae TaxID=3163298 RepID=A0ABW8YRK9_9FLAO